MNLRQAIEAIHGPICPECGERHTKNPSKVCSACLHKKGICCPGCGGTGIKPKTNRACKVCPGTGTVTKVE